MVERHKRTKSQGKGEVAASTLAFTPGRLPDTPLPPRLLPLKIENQHKKTDKSLDNKSNVYRLFM